MEERGKVLYLSIFSSNLLFNKMYTLFHLGKTCLEFGEGTFKLKPEQDSNMVFPLPENEKSFGFSYPVAMYDHDEGNAISGGYEYTGTEVPGLEGKYLFGDITRGRLFYVNIADLKIK